jgi:hypothetical protein
MQTGGMGVTDARIDKKEQAKSLKQIQDYTDVGDYNKAVKYCTMSKWRIPHL